MEPEFFPSADAFREWLDRHHETATEKWVGFYRKHTQKPTLTWPEAVDQALCYGWIDGVMKSIDGERYQRRFTPRKPKSNWSEVNLKRIEELSAQGRVAPAGLAALEARDLTKTRQYSFENKDKGLGESEIAEFQRHEEAWKFFQTQPPSYRHRIGWWVIQAKQEATRQKRLATLIQACEEGRRL